jgi:hypothetical protein
MCENQCGLSDIPQSTAEKVMVRPRSTRPPPESERSLRDTVRFSPASSSRDQRLRKCARRSHTAK